MCDYSLEAYHSVPAAEGEKYTLERFSSGSMGFTTGPGCDTAACVPADTQLRLEGIAESVQQACGVGPVEEVTMIRLESGTYKDAVRFSNGTELLLQRLNPGLTAMLVVARRDLAKLLDLPPAEAKVLEPA
jgi:hypothetical protein